MMTLVSMNLCMYSYLLILKSHPANPWIWSPILCVYRATGIHLVLLFGKVWGPQKSTMFLTTTSLFNFLSNAWKPAFLESALMVCSYFSKTFFLFETFVLLGNFSYQTVETKLGEQKQRNNKQRFQHRNWGVKVNSGMKEFQRRSKRKLGKTVEFNKS